MASDTFVLTKDLEQLNEVERRAHLENVCASLGLDPKAGLLKYAKLDKGDGSGERHLVLYATKGATDKLRDIHGVDVTEITDKVISGAVVYTVKGRNKAGRIDVAVGAAAIENKHGDALAKQFAIAQTRATRRLTLQFSGSGLIDESEVSDNTTSIANAPVPLEEIGAPVPSSAVGVDVTGLTVKLPPTVKHSKLSDGTDVIDVSDFKIDSEPARIPNPAAGLKVVEVVAGTGKAKVEEVTAMAAEAKVLTQIAAVPTQSAEVEAPKTRRKRRTKAEMEAARAEDPKQPSVAAMAAEESAAPVTRPTAAEPVAAEVAPAPASEIKVPLIGDKPTGEQTTAYTARLIALTDRLQHEGGLLPSNGMGPRRKIREFMMIINAKTDLPGLTNPQWENSFRYFDATIAEKGCKGLVEIIEYNLEQVNDLQPA